MEKVINEILNNIAAIYDKYEQKSNSLSEDKKQKLGVQIDKKQKAMIEQLSRIQPKLKQLIAEMDKSSAMKNQELKRYPPLVKQTLQDIQQILRKKNLLFKVNKSLEDLATSTNEQVDIIRKQLKSAGETKILCCGVDGVGKFKATMERFRLNTAQWSLLSKLEPKDSVQTFVSPKFSSDQYRFIKDIISRQWPKDNVRVEYKQIVKQVIKPVYVNNGKASRLVEANEFIFGINRQANIEHGLKIYHQEFNNNNDSAAAAFLGQVYEQGVLLAQDIKKAVNYYNKAMQGKEPYAFYRYAMALINGQLNQAGVNKTDLETGFKILTQAASFENTSAQALVQLGEFYQKGKFDSDQKNLFVTGVDLRKAIQYYSKARALNVPRACNNLGVLYITHKDMSPSNPNQIDENPKTQAQNLEKGYKYLKQAELAGFAQAFYNIGCLLQSGLLGRREEREALNYFYKGSIKGDNQSKLKFAEQLMSQTIIMREECESHYRRAYRWLQSITDKLEIMNSNIPANHGKSKQAIQQMAEAHYLLGLMHEFGLGVEASKNKAFRSFTEASEKGSGPAKNKLGDYYFNGTATSVNRESAIGLYLEAAEQGNPKAMVNLGVIYLNGIANLIQHNYTQAFRYFNEAMRKGDTDAMIHLSYMYKNALGFKEPDMKTAISLLQQAAANRNQKALYLLKKMEVEYDPEIDYENMHVELFNPHQNINLAEKIPYVSEVKF